MKIICTQENLQKYIQFLDKAVVKQSNLPILGNILFETKEGRLKLSATNLEIGITAYVGAKILEEGLVAIPAKLFINFINNIEPGEVVELEQRGMQVFVKSGRFSLTLNVVDGKDFPIIPKKSSEGILIPAQEFKKVLQGILYAVSVNEVRPELCSVYVFYEEGKMYWVATDSFRLVEGVMEVEVSGVWVEALSRESGVLIPSMTLNEVARIIQPDTEAVELVIQDNQVFFFLDGVEVTSRLVNGKFPNYQQIIPKTFQSSVTFSKKDVQRCLKIGSVFSGYTSGEIAILIQMEEGTVSVLVKALEVGENVNTISIQEKTGDMQVVTFVLQARFLQDVMNHGENDSITWSFNDSKSPILLTDGSFGTSGCIMMPIRK